MLNRIEVKFHLSGENIKEAFIPTVSLVNHDTREIYGSKFFTDVISAYQFKDMIENKIVNREGFEEILSIFEHQLEKTS